MGHTRCRFKTRSIFLSVTTLIMHITGVMGQPIPRPPIHLIDGSFFQVIYFSNDSLAYDVGNGHLAKKEVIPHDFEEEKCAYFDGFGVDLIETCSWIRKCDSGKEFIQLSVRCGLFGESLNFIVFPVSPDLSEIDDDYCVPACDDLYFTFGEDSVATILWDVVPSVNVYSLKMKGHRAYLDRFLGTTNRCGLFQLNIPADRDSYYCFYMTDDFVVWLHFLGNTTIHTIPQKPKQP